MNQTPRELMYILDVELPDHSPGKMAVYGELCAGLDPRNDLVLVDPHIGARHFLFTSKNGNLSVHLLDGDRSTFLNTLPLEKDRYYLLDAGDVLTVGKIKIRIRRDLAPVRPEGKTTSKPQPVPRTEIRVPVAEKPVESVVDHPPVEKRKKSSVEHGHSEILNGFKMIPFKFYGFLFDVLFTYAIMAYVLPASGLLSLFQSLLHPMTEFFNTTLTSLHPEISQYKILSDVEFFIVFHFLMVASALILADSPGAFLLGITPKGKSFLGNRFKAYLYALINIVALPIIIADIPLFKGRTLKEWMTFHQREVKHTVLFRLTRVILVPSLMIVALISPLFLKFPYSAVVVESKLQAERYKDVHVKFINSLSSAHGTELKTELNSGFSVLPFLEKGKTGLTLFEHTSGKFLVAKEEWRMKTNEALFKLRFSNPLSSLYLPNENLNNELLKTRAHQSLMVSPVQFAEAIGHFGLFFGNAVLFKQELLKSMMSTESLLLTSFNDKNPFLLISSPTEHRLFWFTPKEIICFDVSVPAGTRLLEHFTRDLLAGMRFTQAYGDKLKTPEILEVLDAFEREKPQSILTYYIYEAKNQTKKDQAWRAFLKKNILQTKLALNGTTNKNIERSFDDIINSIQ